MFILPLMVTSRPSTTVGRTEFTYTGEISGSAPNILNKSYSIKAEIDVPQDVGDGMINTLGGYGLYLLKANP